MPDWIIEEGIGETRAALVDGGEIVEARIDLEGTVRAGTILKARLTNVGLNGRNALVKGEDGCEYLLPAGAGRTAEGSFVTVEVTRGPIPGPEQWKLPLGRVTDGLSKTAQPAQLPHARFLSFPRVRDELAEFGWEELVEQGRTGIVTFAGGELRISLTPAMTLIDVDGYLAAPELAIAGAREAARAIRRLDIGGSIGIDLPTAASKETRQAAGEAIDSILARPFERTSVNGFGFVQVIRPRPRASLLELAYDRTMFEARALLRRVAFESAGSRTIAAHAAIVRALERRPEWLESLSQQLGGRVRLRADASISISGGYAEVT